MTLPESISVVYFGQPNCIACDLVRDFMRALPGRYPNAVFFQVPFGSPVTVDCMWANDVAIYPFVKVFKNFSTVQKCMGYVTGSGTTMIDDLIKTHYQFNFIELEDVVVTMVNEIAQQSQGQTLHKRTDSTKSYTSLASSYPSSPRSTPPLCRL
ncbi:hypothetical protein PPL_03413 [Heterostelium album PN500]|uniref:Uncharacterized protein n=1 Tax=Heterostelium pallidum (strain ATCC 26659 / Pp 5 / PN500) TaxID=670386 RepID=D3B4T7_HETP5|nr:hypothetical protein PPL_03413 [Heterostelium album PN500]EFA84335.1 hypothetical protein PPL_03413 [Heterostelium album PN500]|eukprot:XP_020436450.1 hypothetical protein PPL_03413 [Heterostelium album PN500]